MLFYVGKDLARWIEQCLEFASAIRTLFPVASVSKVSLEC